MQIGSGSVTSLISREAAGRILFDPGITFARALLHSSVTNVGKLRGAVGDNRTVLRVWEYWL